MDFNLFVLEGTVAAEPERRTFESGSSLVRYLVTTRTVEPRRRVDVLPVTMWNDDGASDAVTKGDRIWIAGSPQRRFWSADGSRRSRIELVAHHIKIGQNDVDEAGLVEAPPDG